MGQGLPTILAAYASMKRIQSFLEMDEKSSIAGNTGDGDQEEKSQDPESAQEKSIDTTKLTMDNASFSWLPDSPVVLNDVTLSLLPGKLHMCVGPVASVSASPYSISLIS